MSMVLTKHIQVESGVGSHNPKIHTCLSDATSVQPSKVNQIMDQCKQCIESFLCHLHKIIHIYKRQSQTAKLLTDQISLNFKTKLAFSMISVITICLSLPLESLSSAESSNGMEGGDGAYFAAPHPFHFMQHIVNVRATTCTMMHIYHTVTISTGPVRLRSIPFRN